MSLTPIRILATTARLFGSLSADEAFIADQELADLNRQIRQEAEYFGGNLVEPGTRDALVILVERYAAALDGAAERESARWEGGYPGITQRTRTDFAGTIQAARDTAQHLAVYHAAR